MCKDLLLQDNKLVDAWNILGAASLRALQHKEAADAFKKALAIAPRRADLHLNYGSTLEKLGDIERACSAEGYQFTANVIGGTLRHRPCLPTKK